MGNLAMQNGQFSPKKWYKTWKGILFLTILVFIVVSAIIFMAFFAYYLWQIKYGDVGKLNEEFSVAQITSGSSLLKAKEGKDKNIVDIKQYIRPVNPVFGNKNAKITIVEFIDFECAFCRQAHPAFRAVMEKYQPVAQFIFKHLPLSDLHSEAMAAANASACAQEQGKFWEYENLLFEKQKLDHESLLDYAENLKLNSSQFNLCLTSEKYKAQVEQDLLDAAELGLRGTPTYFINGVKVEGVVTGEEWDKIIAGLLKELKMQD